MPVGFQHRLDVKGDEEFVLHDQDAIFVQGFISFVAGLSRQVRREIPGSADYFAVIEEQITGCILQIGFLTQSAVDSRWVRQEIFFGDNLNKPIWLEEKIRLHSGLNIVLARRQYLQASDPTLPTKFKDAIAFAARPV